MADVAQNNIPKDVTLNGNVEKGFQERLAEIPAYNYAYSQLTNLYSFVKEKNKTMETALNTGEEYVEKLTTAAKPVVWAATNTALSVAKPVVGEINDPVGKIDSIASGALAKVQEKIPIVKEDPVELAGFAKEKAKETANYYYEKAQSSCIVKRATKQLDNAVALSELAIELCFPTDASVPEDVEELEKAEEDEDKGILVRAGNVRDRAVRRGTKKLLTLNSVQASVDTYQFVQKQISEMTEKVIIGTNYVKERSDKAKEALSTTVEESINGGTELMSKQWDNVYRTTMYIPKKALQVSGKVYVSAQEMVFAYGNADTLNEMPHAVVEKVEQYYDELKKDTPVVGDLEEKARVFVSAPTQVIADYLKYSKLVQWIIPTNINTESMQLMATETEETENTTTSI